MSSWNVYDGAGAVGAVGKASGDDTLPCREGTLSEDMTRRIFTSFFAEKGLYSHLIESYDEMFRVWLPHMIAEFGKVIVCSERTQTLHLLTILPPTEIRKPQKREKMGYVSDLSVREARDRGLTYEAHVITNIIHEVYTPTPGSPRIELPRRNSSNAGDYSAQEEPPSSIPAAISTIRPIPGMLSGEGSVSEGSEATTYLLLRYAGMAVPVPWVSSSDVLDGIVSPTAQWTMDDGVTASCFDFEDQGRAKPDPALFTLTHRSVSKDVKLFSVPVMVGSNRCHTKDIPPVPSDPWNRQEGYCVVNGMEKVFMPQLNPIANTIIVRAPVIKNEVQTTRCEMRCRHWSKIRATATMYVEIVSSYRGTGMVLANIRVPFIEESIPLFAFMRLIGFATIDQAAVCIANRGANSVAPSRKDPETGRFVLWLKSMLRNRMRGEPDFEILSQEEIVNWVGQNCLRKEKRSAMAVAMAAGIATSEAVSTAGHSGHSGHSVSSANPPAAAAAVADPSPSFVQPNRKYIHHILSNEFLPQVGLDMSELTLAKKRAQLSFIVWRVSKVARHELPADDRDHFGNQMIETPGRLVIHLLRQLYRNALQKRTVKMMKVYADSGRHFTPADCIPSRKLTNDLGYAMSTGSWGVQKSGSARKGIIQVFKRINPLASLSNLRSFKKPGDIKDMAPRLLRTQDWGIACPSETSEGENCGLLKHLAGHATITQGRPTRQMLEAVVLLFGDRLRPESSHPSAFLVMVNGVALGWVGGSRGARGDEEGGDHAELAETVRWLRQMRRSRLLPHDAEIYHSESQGAVYITAENGAVRRPLIYLGEGRAQALANLESVREVCARADDDSLFSELLRRGLVEFIGKNEEGELVVRADPSVEDEVDETMEGLGLREVCDLMTALGLDADEVQAASAEAARQVVAEGGTDGDVKLAVLETRRRMCREALLGSRNASVKLTRFTNPSLTKFPYTHMEIHASAIHSLSTALIPFSNNNQAPRNTYQCAMGKAALGEPQEVDEARTYMRMMEAQVPLVQTFNERMLNPRYMRSGMNVIVAIVCFEGNNEEDSLNMCRSDLHLGMFRTWDYRVYADAASMTSRSDPQTFEKPDDDVRGKRDSDYSLLGPAGFVPPGTIVRGGTAVIGKTVRVHGNIKRDQSVITDESAPPGIVTSVLFADSKDRKRIKLQVARPAVPIIGDKFSARHGQKGVMGDKIAREDMPWGLLPMQVRNGKGQVVGTKMTEVRPNILMNPNAIPSRMTVGQLLEMVAGTAAAAGGYIADGTSFMHSGSGSGLRVDELQDELRRLGLNSSGTVKLNSGLTGEPLYNAEVFMGVCLYQRLKQLAEAKARAVDRGVTSALTRQPMEGKNGGLRCGEMERDAFIAHGAPKIVVNTYLERSDDYVAYACTRCGMLACPPRRPDERLRHLGGSTDEAGFCTYCQSAEHVARFRTPYALKLMTQELMTLGIVPRFDIQTSETIDFANAPAVGVPAREQDLPTLARNPTQTFATQTFATQTFAAQPSSSAQTFAAQPLGPSALGSFPAAGGRAARVESLPGGVNTKGPDIVVESDDDELEFELGDYGV
jgi:DNA-directed RNA polymerase II subunit RPB2